MKNLKKRIGLCLLLFSWFTFEASALAAEMCQGDSNLVDSCFSIRGQLAGYQGYPDWRIWWVGTKRVLGILGGEEPRIPGEVREILEASTFDFDKSAVYADFLVCPFTKQKPDSMQIVCVESAKNIRV